MNSPLWCSTTKSYSMAMSSGKSCLQNAITPCMPILDLQSRRSSPPATEAPSVRPSRCQRSRVSKFSSSRSMGHLVRQPQQRADVRAEFHRLARLDIQLRRQGPFDVDLFEPAVGGEWLLAEVPHPR